VAPRAFGDPEAAWEPDNWIENASGAVGALVAALALASLWPATRRLPLERLVGAGLLATLLLVAQPPGFDRLVGGLPVVGATAAHQHHRLLLFAALAACVLAAAEVERWARGERRWRALLAGGAVVAALVAWAYLGHPPPATARVALPPAAWLAIELGALTAGVTLLLVVAPPSARQRRRALAVPLALAALAASELLALHGVALRSAPGDLFYPRVPPLRFLQQHLGGDRFLGLGLALLPSCGQLYDLADLRTENPAEPWVWTRVGTMLRGGNTAEDRISWGERSEASLFDLLGVRYVLTAPGRVVPHAHAVLRAPSGWVHERRHWLPRVFLPPVAIADDGDDWLGWLVSPRDLATRALVAPSPQLLAGQRWRATTPAELRIVARETTLLRAVATVPESRLLASSTYQDGGWRVLVDGVPVPPVRTDGIFVGAWLPAGARQVALVYRPRGALVGGALAALAASLLCAWLLPPPRSRRAPGVTGVAAVREGDG
jgi:hypothetical protein